MVHHRRGLRRELEKSDRSGKQADLFCAALEDDWQQADLTPADRAILDYAVQLTADPAGMTSSRVERLREHGLDDRAIHDICCITAYFAFVNRVADGLGVELESDD